MHVTVANIETSFNDTGEGRVVVLLHGWGTNKDNFKELQRDLSAQFRVLSLDLPGFGNTGKPGADWHIEEYVRFVSDFLRVVGIQNVYAFVAHSFGGRICIKGLAAGTLDAEKLVLIGSAGVTQSKSLKNVAFATVAKTGKLVMRLPFLRTKYDVARQKLHEKAGSTDYTNAGDMQQVFLNAIHEDLKDAARSLALPTLLIWGSEDTETPLSDARYFHSVIKGSTLRIVQGASHFVHTEHPEKIAKWVKEFLI